MSPEAVARLRAVRDCGVLRAHMGDVGLVELVRKQLVYRRFIQGQNPRSQCDYLLTENGKPFAERLPSGMVYHRTA